MKRYLFLGCSIIAISLTTSLYAEVMPNGYYDAIQGTSDSTLKATLHQIIKGGERYQYGTNSYHTTNKVVGGDTIWKIGDFKAYGTWYGFQLADRLSNGCVWDMYSTTKRHFPMQGGSAAGMNIEHCLPKSWWGGTENDAYNDLYHLNPSDQAANNNKSNFPPGILNDSSKVNNGTFFMGEDSRWGGFAFTVVNEYKGDFARAYFYVATAYHDMEWDNDYSKYVTNDSYLTFTPYLMDILLQWHRIDPVSEKEINRLDAISSIQHNRNPFIEYPELVEYIWGNKQGQEVNLSELVCTTSEDYVIPTDTINPMAYPATDITPQSFNAHWKDQQRASYLLEVYTLEESGSNDTLIAMHGFNKDIVNASNGQIQWLKEDGSAAQYRQMDGSHATSLSSTTEKRQIRFSNFGKTTTNTFLTVKCCVYKGDKTADLIVRGNDDVELYEQPLVLDEEYYTFAIPEGTTTISLVQKEIGKSKNYHRISVQAAYLYTGDYTITEQPLADFPIDIEGTSYTVEHAISTPQTIYYRVTPEGLRTSNIIAVAVNSTVNIQQPTTPPTYQKILRDGELLIIHNNQTYDVLGRKK